MIVRSGGGYIVKSKSSKKKLSRVYRSKSAALKRLRQIEYFKARGG